MAETAQIFLKTDRYRDRDEHLKLCDLINHEILSGHSQPFMVLNFAVLQNILGREQTLVEAVYDGRGIRFLVLSEEEGLVGKLGDAVEDSFGEEKVFDGNDVVYGALLNHITKRATGKRLLDVVNWYERIKSLMRERTVGQLRELVDLLKDTYAPPTTTSLSSNSIFGLLVSNPHIIIGKSLESIEEDVRAMQSIRAEDVPQIAGKYSSLADNAALFMEPRQFVRTASALFEFAGTLGASVDASLDQELGLPRLELANTARLVGTELLKRAGVKRAVALRREVYVLERYINIRTPIIQQPARQP